MKIYASISYTVADLMAADVVLEADSENDALDKLGDWIANNKGDARYFQTFHDHEVSETVIDLYRGPIKGAIPINLEDDAS